MNTKQKGFAHFILIVILALIGIGAIGYFAYKSGQIKFNPSIRNSTSGTDETENWNIYTTKEGKYSIKYPTEYEVIQNGGVSVDGVRIPAVNTLTLISGTLPDINTNFVLTIEYKFAKGLSLGEFIDTNSWCADILSEKAKIFTINGNNALIFENTPCGPYGSTVIYTSKGDLVYEIRIESHAPYEKVKSQFNQILSTFKFLD